MRYIEVEHPHGFLIWREKQRSIASNKTLPIDEELLLVCNNEAYCKIKLAQPAAVNLSEFERLQDEHSTRPEERKMLWPDVETFYIHSIKEIEQFSGSVPVEIIDGDAKILGQPELTESEQELLRQVDRLPNKIILNDKCVVLDNNILQLTENIDYSKALQIYAATIGEKSIDGELPLYQLALIRRPHLIIKRKDAEEKIEEDKQEGEDMPYEIVQEHEDCEQFAVVKIDDRRLMGCHSTEEEAQAQIAALNIAEAESDEQSSVEEEIQDKQFDDSEWDGAASNWPTTEAFCRDSLIDVNPAGEDKIQALCKLPFRKPGSEQPNLAALRNIAARFNQLEKPADVSSEDWNSAVGAAARRLARWWPEAFDSEPPEIIANAAKDEHNEDDEKAGRRIKKTWHKRLQEAYDTIKEMLAWSEYEDEKHWLTGQTGFAIKQVNDEPWFFAWSTNAFQDREQEIFSTKALEKYVLEAEAKEDRGHFNVWHIPNTDFAKKEWQGVVGRILVEAGPFLKDGKGQEALKFFKQFPDNHPELAPEGWGMSPEYRFLPEDRSDGIYEWIWITRTSVLAKAVAANIYTKGGLQMALTDEQKEAAQQIFGEGLAVQIIADAEQESKELEEAGVAHKEKKEESIEEEKPEITIEAVAGELAKQLDFSSLTEAMEKVTEQVKEFGTRLSKVEEKEEIKLKDETPRVVLQLVKRASEADETEVEDGDKLKEQKPKETQAKDGSLAEVIFNPGR